jgi:hypothetical protein
MYDPKRQRKKWEPESTRKITKENDQGKVSRRGFSVHLENSVFRFFSKDPSLGDSPSPRGEGAVLLKKPISAGGFASGRWEELTLKRRRLQIPASCPHKTIKKTPMAFIVKKKGREKKKEEVCVSYTPPSIVKATSHPLKPSGARGLQGTRARDCSEKNQGHRPSSFMPASPQADTPPKNIRRHQASQP